MIVSFSLSIATRLCLLFKSIRLSSVDSIRRESAAQIIYSILVHPRLSIFFEHSRGQGVVLITTLIAGLLLLSPAQGEINPLADDFSRFEQALTAQDDRDLAGDFSITRRRQVDEFSYLLVAGYGNELGRGHYFHENASALREMGASAVEIFFPSSKRSAADNIELLRARILQLYESTGKPVVIFGHSKGGLEALATLLSNPKLVTDGHVANAVLIQSPVGGNTLIEQRGLIGRFFAEALSFFPSFRSLRTPAIQSLIADRISVWTESKSDLRAVARAVRYVISSKPVAESGAFFRWQAHVLPHRIPNDGLVATQDMWIPGFGLLLGSLNVDHLEVLLGRNVPFLVDNVSRLRVRAFTKSMVLNLLKSRNPDNRAYRELTIRQTIERQGPRRCDHLFLSTAL